MEEQMNWESCVNWFVNNKDWIEIVIPVIAALPAVCVIIKYLYNIIGKILMFLKIVGLRFFINEKNNNDKKKV